MSDPGESDLGASASGETAPSAPSGLATLLDSRVTTLGDFVRAVTAEGVGRRRLSEEVAHSLASEASAVQSELWALPDGGAGARRQTLETRLAMLAEAHRQEQVACWRDLEQVQRERRTWLKEYLELRQRMTLLHATPVPAGHQ